MTHPWIHAGGSHDLKPVPTDTLAHYAAPSPTSRSLSPKPAVTMPKRSVTKNREGRSRWTEMTGHVGRNTQQPPALPIAAWINPPTKEATAKKQTEPSAGYADHP